MSEEPIPLKRCVHWNHRVHVSVMASAKKQMGGHVKNNTLTVMRKSLDELVFVLTHCNVHLFQHICEQFGTKLCCPRSFSETNVRFLHGHPKMLKSATAQAVRSCAARVWIFGSSHNDESPGCSKIKGMCKFAMASLAKITLGEHEVCCRGGAIIPATHVLPSTSTRKPNIFISFVKKPDPSNM